MQIRHFKLSLLLYTSVTALILALPSEAGGLRSDTTLSRICASLKELKLICDTPENHSDFLNTTLAAYYLSGTCKLNQHDPKAAMQLVQRALTFDPVKPRAYLVRSEIESALGQPEAAAADKLRGRLLAAVSGDTESIQSDEQSSPKR